MSWHYLQGQVAASWEESCSDGAPDALLKLIPTGEQSCFSDKRTEFSSASLSGTIYAPSTVGPGVGELTSFPEDSLARTLAPPEKAPALMVKNPGYGARWRELSARFDRVACSWKIHRGWCPEDLPESSVILPAWGMVHDGVCWELMTSERRTSVSGCGWSRAILGSEKLLPTPAASDYKGQYTWETVQRRMTMARGVRLSEELCRRVGKAITPNPELWEWMMGWPIGSTGLQPLEMGKFQLWLEQHGCA